MTGMTEMEFNPVDWIWDECGASHFIIGAVRLSRTFVVTSVSCKLPIIIILIMCKCNQIFCSLENIAKLRKFAR